jgi:hypothetical protein
MQAGISPMRLPTEALETTEPADCETENDCGRDEYDCVHDDSPCSQTSIDYVDHERRPHRATSSPRPAKILPPLFGF